MNGWMVFLVIAFIAGTAISNIILLRKTGNTKLPEDLLRRIKKRNEEADKQDQ